MTRVFQNVDFCLKPHPSSTANIPNSSSAWSRLAVIDREKAITNRDLAVIDLRIPEQLIVEPNIPVRGNGSET